jgi:diacylglycerol kinase (ATP)
LVLHSRKLALIANLSSRNHHDQSRFDQYALDTLENQQIQVAFYKTESLQDLQKAVIDCLEAGIKEFVAIGGDGSLHHLINQLFSHANDISQIKLAIIPKGTGNDYIRNFNFKSKRDILQSILSENYSHVDLGLSALCGRSALLYQYARPRI